MNTLSIAVPTSTILNEPGLLLKTLRIYEYVRYCSIFGVEELVFYNDGFTRRSDHYRAVELITKIWRYLITPPYLRRKLIPIDKDLRYVGILPPLRLEIFNVSKRPVSGEKRLGLIIEKRGRLYVDIGLDKLFRLEDKCGSVGEIILVEVTDPITGIAVCVDEQVYRGPILGFEDSFTDLLEYYSSKGFVVIATSRYGKIPGQDELEELSSYDRIALLFGSPRHGLYDIASKNGVKLGRVVKYIWNTVPRQRVKTVRTEEAVIITLGIVNMFLRRS